MLPCFEPFFLSNKQAEYLSDLIDSFQGFFRRTCQKNMLYQCDYGSKCIVDKTTRTQCQKCRFDKCLAVGMTPHTVLNERQRVVKRQIREENRVRQAETCVGEKQSIAIHLPILTESSSLLGSDEEIIQIIAIAYLETFIRNGASNKVFLFVIFQYHP